MALDVLPGVQPLPAALAALARRTTGATVSVTLHGESVAPRTVEEAAYAVAAEGVANAVAHGGVTLVEIDVHRGAGRLAISVTDDGLGGARAVPGHGLEALAGRVAEVGGTLTIESPAWAGTSLHAVLPLTGGVSHPSHPPPL